MKEFLNAKSWNEFKRNLKGLSTKKKGDAFELLVKHYLLTDTKYSSLLSHVWIYDEIPHKVHQKLNLPPKDMGIDLIARTKNHLYWAIQCKYRDNEQEQITWSELM